MTLKVSDDARWEALDAADWYDEKRLGLGANVHDCLPAKDNAPLK